MHVGQLITTEFIKIILSPKEKSISFRLLCKNPTCRNKSTSIIHGLNGSSLHTRFEWGGALHRRKRKHPIILEIDVSSLSLNSSDTRSIYILPRSQGIHNPLLISKVCVENKRIQSRETDTLPVLFLRVVSVSTQQQRHVTWSRNSAPDQR
jgi:hypothetical protein